MEALPQVFQTLSGFLNDVDLTDKNLKLKQKKKDAFIQFLNSIALITTGSELTNDSTVTTIAWPNVFYQRLVFTQSTLSIDEFHRFYLLADAFLQKAKEQESKYKRWIAPTKALVAFLEHHETDPDNSLVGLAPSAFISEKYYAWREKKTYVAEDPCALNNSSTVFSSYQGRSLFWLGLPHLRGDLIVTVLSADQDKRDLRRYNPKNDPDLLTDLNQDSSSSSSSSSSAPEAPAQTLVFARVQDAVELNKNKFLKLHITPNEEQVITVAADLCVSVRHLKPDTFESPLRDRSFRSVSAMRDLVQDPSKYFKAHLMSEIVRRLHELLLAYEVDLKSYLRVLKQNPPRFSAYYMIKKTIRRLEIVAQFDSDSDESKTNRLARKAQKMYKKIQQWANEEIQSFVLALNQESQAINYSFFLPTFGQDLLSLKIIHVDQLLATFLKKIIDEGNAIVNTQSVERKELLNGNLKQQISKWWLLMIRAKSEAVLSNTGYDHTAFNPKDYIDTPPNSIAAVKTNLHLVQRLIDPKDPIHNIIVESMDYVKREVYPVIEKFIYKSTIVLHKELFGDELPYDFTIETEIDFKKYHDHFAAVKDKLAARKSEQLIQQIDGLLKDVNYLHEMKQLERSVEISKSTGQTLSLTLSNAVPVSGIFMGHFVRLENMLKTVIELWNHLDVTPFTASTPASSSSSSSSSQTTPPVQSSSPSSTSSSSPNSTPSSATPPPVTQPAPTRKSMTRSTSMKMAKLSHDSATDSSSASSPSSPLTKKSPSLSYAPPVSPAKTQAQSAPRAPSRTVSVIPTEALAEAASSPSVSKSPRLLSKLAEALSPSSSSSSSSSSISSSSERSGTPDLKLKKPAQKPRVPSSRPKSQSYNEEMMGLNPDDIPADLSASLAPVVAASASLSSPSIASPASPRLESSPLSTDNTPKKARRKAPVLQQAPAPTSD